MIKHWINGREVESKDVFENYNPATGELIGEVASGGAAEIDAAVAAAREAFPKWAIPGQGARAPDAPARRADRPERAAPGGTGDPRHRPADPPDEERADPARLAQLRVLRRSLHADERAQLSGRRPDAQLHPVPAGGRLRPGLAVERTVHDRHLEDRAVPGAGQHGGAEDVRAVAADRQRAGPPGARGGHSAGGVQRGPGLRRQRRRRAGSPPRRARGVLHRRHRHRATDHGGGRDQEILDGTGRQVAGAGLRRRRPRAGAGRRAVHHLLAERRTLHRRQSHLRPGKRLPAVRRRVRRARQAPDRRRSAGPEDPGRLDDHPGPLRQGHRLHPHRPRGRRHPGGRRPGASGRPAGAPEQGAVHPAHGVRRRGQPHAHRPGGDLRPGGLPDPVQGRSRGAAPGQRRGIRPGLLHLDPGHRQGPSPGTRHRGRDGLHQQPERARPAPAVRRGEGLGHRTRRRGIQLRGIRRDQERVYIHGQPSHPRWGV